MLSSGFQMYLVGGLREQNLNWVEITQFSSRNPKSIAGRAVQWAIRISCPGARLCGETDKWLCAHLFVVNTNAR